MRRMTQCNCTKQQKLKIVEIGRLPRVVPLIAELWDGPSSKAVAIYEMSNALLTGESPDLGENRKVTVDMR